MGPERMPTPGPSKAMGKKKASTESVHAPSFSSGLPSNIVDTPTQDYDPHLHRYTGRYL